MRSLLLLLLAGCATVPVTPEPVAGATCGDAHARAVELGCKGSESDAWVATCERYEAERIEAFAYHPECMASAPSCKALEACRGE